MKIGTKIILLTFSIVSLFGFVLGLYIVRHETLDETERLHKHASAIAINLGEDCEYAVLVGNREEILRLAKNTLSQENVLSCSIESNKFEPIRVDSNKPAEQSFEFTTPIWTQSAALNTHEELLLGITSAEKVKIGTVTVSVSMLDLYNKIRQLKRDVALIVLATILIASLSYSLLMKFIIIGPIKQLVQGTQKIAGGDLNYVVKIQSQDEIGNLSTAFNAMAKTLQLTLVSKNALEESYAQLKLAQDKLVQSEKMSAIGQLAAGVAHEINNPMGVILGFAQSVLTGLKADDPLRMPLEFIEQEAVRCKNLVRDLLTFSRVNPLERGPVDINQAISGALSLVKATVKVNSIEIKSNLSPDLPPLYGNSNQIQQIIINLANNSVDALAGRTDGVLEISTGLIETDSLPYICLKVSDNGTGIPPEILSKVFDPFFTTKPIGKGTGLGLSLIYEIVQKHSGAIELNSRPGRTEFIIHFPIQIPDEAHHAEFHETQEKNI